MKFETKFEVLQLADLVTPPYNPRVDMEPDSPEYKSLFKIYQNAIPAHLFPLAGVDLT